MISEYTIEMLRQCLSSIKDVLYETNKGVDVVVENNKKLETEIIKLREFIEALEKKEAEAKSL